MSEPLREVSAVIEVIDPPTVDRLYFFAVQASFASAGRHEGAGHVGLQWNPRHADSTAINWGGYHRDGHVLAGTRSDFPSTIDDPNTRDFAWVPGVGYRLTIGPATVGELDSHWPAHVENLDTGERAEIRQLICRGDQLRNPVVWAEVFADCDQPPVEVRWRELLATTMDGRTLEVTQGRVSYQAHQDGGCANTSVVARDGSIVQRSNEERATPHNASLIWKAR